MSEPARIFNQDTNCGDIAACIAEFNNRLRKIEAREDEKKNAEIFLLRQENDELKQELHTLTKRPLNNILLSPTQIQRSPRFDDPRDPHNSLLHNSNNEEQDSTLNPVVVTVTPEKKSSSDEDRVVKKAKLSNVGQLFPVADDHGPPSYPSSLRDEESSKTKLQMRNPYLKRKNYQKPPEDKVLGNVGGMNCYECNNGRRVAITLVKQTDGLMWIKSPNRHTSAPSITAYIDKDNFEKLGMI
jgi:hypothetical protein